MNYTTILFDWDGCLAKTLDIWLNAYETVFKSEAISVSRVDIVGKAFGQREKGMEVLGSKDPAISWSKVVEFVNNNITNVELYDGALNILIKLTESGKKLALLTSSDKSTVTLALKALDLEKYFNVVITKDDVVNKKPDPEQIIKALEKLNSKASEAIIIGDSYHDIQAGKNAGTATCAFYPEHNELFYSKSDIEKENPDYIVTSFEEFLRIIN